MFGLGPLELMIVGVIAVLLFGSRLPEVGRSLGKSIVEFKKGMRDIQDEVRVASNSVDDAARLQHRSARPSSDDHDEPTAPKFEPPTSEPQATGNTVGGNPAGESHASPNAPAAHV